MKLFTDRLRPALAGLVSTVLLASCGGVGQDGTGAAPDTQTSGVVNGFGSVIVNGIHYDVGAARISLDGVPGARQSDLRVGMVVTVNGTLSADGSSGIASSLSYESQLHGNIEDTPAAGSLQVLGQRVVLDETTLFSGVADSTELRRGDRLQVSGLREADGSLRATWIQREAGAGTPQFAGFIAAVAGNVVQVAGLQIDITNATLVGVTPATLAPGQLVRLVLQGAPVAGAAVARQLSLIDLRLPDTVRKRQIQGFVNGWDAGAGRFNLYGQAVQIDAATEFQNGGLADLGNGVRVEVRGSLGADRVLKADSLRVFRPLLSAYGRGKVSSVDVAGRRFTLDTPGLEVRLRAGTLLNDSSIVGAILRPDNLAVGDEVLVLGRDNGNRIDADLVHRLPRINAGAGVGGPVGQIAGSILTILDVSVNTNLATFYDAQGVQLSQAAFLAALQPNDLVRAEGGYVGATLLALVVRRVR